MATKPELTLKYASMADSVPDAFAFVMEHLDKVGPAPSIHITPIWDEESPAFDVSVEGTIEEED